MTQSNSPAGWQLGRRRFLELAGLATAATTTGCLPFVHLKEESPAGPLADGAIAGRTEKLGSWQDLYRQRWTWDRVAKGTHGWLNCRSACNFDLYVKDGVVVREEQSATYEASEPGVPDFNPRGCQKGACYTEVMYGPSRLSVPLKRVGERGAGQWEQISWDQALAEIGEKLVKIAEKDGADSIIHDLGPHFDNGPTTAARVRFFGMMGATLSDDWAEIGDLNHGATLTFGFPHVGGGSDEWFLSDYLVVWMMNPAVTQIPDAHFLFEAKYDGAELVVVDPQYSATAVHADQWLPIRPGADTALALATAKHIWDSGRMDLDYVREQTDLPVLVRLDTGRFLNESDLEEGGRASVVFVWDADDERPVPAPGSPDNTRQPRLDDGKVEPPIEGRFSITLADGSETFVVPVGSLLREHLEAWSFEAAAEVTGLAVEQVREFAEGFARAERPMVLSSWGSNRYLHSDQMNRAKILCLSLKGAVGRKGSGYHSTGWIETGSLGIGDKTGLAGRLALFSQIGMGTLFDMAIDRVRGRISEQRMMWELGDILGEDIACMTNAASMNLAIQGIADDLDREQDGLYPRPLSAYDREAREKDWMPRLPKDKARAWVTGGNNVLRRSNLPQRSLEHLWPELELIVDVNPKFTFTGMHADYLLPAAGYYEKRGIKYAVAYIPYLHYCDAAVDPIGESKDEWWIFWKLAQEVQRVALERGTPELDGCGKFPVDLSNFGDRFSFYGKFGPEETDKVTQEMLNNAATTDRMTVAELEKTGTQKFQSAGGPSGQPQLFNDEWKGEGVLYACTHFTEEKWPWPTRTGRQQFYIDHPWFLEVGEALPTHIESPKAGGDLPFQLISCHARWSIHSVWRDDPMMLRLQRGEPALYLNPDDAQREGIDDGDWAELENRIGKVYMRVKYSTMVRPGVAYYFHAWEPHQFPDHESYKFVTPGLMNPLHFAGGEGQLSWRFGVWEPGTQVQDTRVAIRPGRPAGQEVSS
ncbi:MAG: molybdopterin-dependent oxidoreductase [Myxococcota bacterium]|jgi:DMSO reductase family type II enzyme molybdopterin subunit|nr:molybdopterin-dependent oxidoreductase [Myxococcota bacterium]